ncbi:MAG: flavodoxin-dependent (E)-4-hydroxy-3-methylbut-2-enyl-diphosphate synthase [Alphaproteobacteria bacterium]|nr:flavodoxin-dependent (E)-4-hydroxy-3-methylbut-2-enyl-diphosphate synthase [Alphaproteobacteria bacterium]
MKPTTQKRRISRKIYVGDVAVGGDAPITVQSMTNTLTSDVKSTVEQIKLMGSVGADIVRVSCPDEDSTKALPEILKQVNVPIIADIHFHYKRGIEAAKAGASCLRINPGNIGSADRVAEVVKAAKDYNCSIRIGINGGSLEKKLLEKYGEPCPDAMVESALSQLKMLEDLDFFETKISVKSSDTLTTIEAYEKLAAACDYPLHLGVTEAGSLRTGTVKSAMGLGALLMQGIGDTLRVSLSADVTEEIKVGYDILKYLNLRHRGIRFISCPTCARKGYDVEKIVSTLEDRLAHITTNLSVSILGCVVNGPGEAKETDIGLTGGSKGKHAVYIKGELDHTIEDTSEDNNKIIEHMVKLIESAAK